MCNAVQCPLLGKTCDFCLNNSDFAEQGAGLGKDVAGGEQEGPGQSSHPLGSAAAGSRSSGDRAVPGRYSQSCERDPRRHAPNRWNA